MKLPGTLPPKKRPWDILNRRESEGVVLDKTLLCIYYWFINKKKEKKNGNEY